MTAFQSTRSRHGHEYCTKQATLSVGSSLSTVTGANLQSIAKHGNNNPVPEAVPDPELDEPIQVTPFKAFIGAIQALAIAAGLLFFATKVDTVILSSPLPDQHTARNLAITVRTIIRGLVYLATFIFAANGVGLAALALKLLILGDDEDVVEGKESGLPALPKIGLTSDIDDVMHAFDEASDVERYKKRKAQQDSAKG
jgi:hypothetical protein